MAAIMQKAASLNEEKENEQIGLIHRLATENCVSLIEWHWHSFECFRIVFFRLLIESTATAADN